MAASNRVAGGLLFALGQLAPQVRVSGRHLGGGPEVAQGGGDPPQAQGRIRAAVVALDVARVGLHRPPRVRERGAKAFQADVGGRPVGKQDGRVPAGGGGGGGGGGAAIARGGGGQGQGGGVAGDGAGVAFG